MMSEVFEELAVIGNAISEEDRVIHLLASLPDSCNVLVTALEAQSENVPKWSLLTETVTSGIETQRESFHTIRRVVKL